MTTAHRTNKLSRGKCVALLRSGGSVRVGSVSINGGRPIRLACVFRPDGSIVIPTGSDCDLVAAAAGQQVAFEFEERVPDGRRLWLVRVVGHARSIERRDRPRATETETALTMSYAFENGIRVGVDRLTGRATNES